MAAGTLGSRVLPGRAAEVSEHSSRAPTISSVYEAHFRYVWRCLRSVGVSDASVDDALQDVFLVVQRRLPEFDGQSAELRTWLYAIALRVARKYRSRSRREAPPREQPIADEEREAPHADVEDAAESSERLLLARAALDTLDDEKREVFVLSRVEQMSASEIARVLGVPINTVYSRLRAARLAFDAAVQRLQLRRRKSP